MCYMFQMAYKQISFKKKTSVCDTYEDNFSAVLVFLQEMLTLFILRLKLGYHSDQRLDFHSSSSILLYFKTHAFLALLY